MVSVKIFPEMVRFKRVNDEITETSKALNYNIYILQSPLLVLFFFTISGTVLFKCSHYNFFMINVMIHHSLMEHT